MFWVARTLICYPSLNHLFPEFCWPYPSAIWFLDIFGDAGNGLYSDVRAQRQSQSGPREKILLEKKYYRMMWRWHSNFLRISIYINKMLSLQSKYREHKWKRLWMYLNQLKIAKILTARLHIHIRKVHFFNPEGNSVLRIPSQYPKHRKSQRIIRRFQGYHTGLIKRSFLRHPSNNFEQGKRQTRQVESSRTVRLACVHLLFYWKSFFSTDHRSDRH